MFAFSCKHNKSLLLQINTFIVIHLDQTPSEQVVDLLWQDKNGNEHEEDLKIEIHLVIRYTQTRQACMV